MPKGKKQGSKRASVHKLAKMAEAVSTAQAQPEANPNPAANMRADVVVITGGTKKNPVKENAANWKPVTPEMIGDYANSRKAVTVGLAMNLLAGVVLSADIRNRNHALWQPRSLKTDKLSFFKLLESNVSRQDLVKAWELSLAERSRYDAPTLQSLWGAVRSYMVLGGKIERKASPMETFARELIDVINNRTLTQEEIIRTIRAKLVEKANYDAQAPQQQQAAA
jgi:hypothetical protein